MPYNIQRDGNKYKVVVTSTGRVVGTHPSKAQAQAQLGALYTNVKDVRKCMTCGCDDFGNDHHYISDTEKCISCMEKGQGPCWDGYEYAGTKEQDGKTVPNCVPVKKESAGAGRISGGVGWSIEFNTQDCQHGWAVLKGGTGQSIGCYLTKEEAEKALEALAVTEPVIKSDQTHQDEQDGIGSFSFWNGSFAPVMGNEKVQYSWMSTYNSPPQNDGKPNVGYGNSSGKNGRSNQ